MARTRLSRLRIGVARSLSVGGADLAGRASAVQAWLETVAGHKPHVTAELLRLRQCDRIRERPPTDDDTFAQSEKVRDYFSGVTFFRIAVPSSFACSSMAASCAFTYSD
jgi:hypothetical protein